ncbi:conserved hypothetical protein TIGR00278 [Cellvibrio japonicus Ueda107]|uniref:Putative membrane protein insertion efficiency factor n=1 Tax=Cellvibrio japonicus (strain Ueda107) TaxID=498211 RepID=YIDD_CELJU|nr:RecName: Full=Putative membrane protein insertion efficiency factor [Cellvibrio japonicus Ueda107]ACE83127.1 conserved hypothetical protein TIGR00278 [Cellvibrio japonicus Ueda107]QEI14341.1 membrane protein insertion efficiency factor YidD [Cellvibrio japonicus]QEI17918.1 membrane protein insertion efficiency factor YidD [Cellvibrio japonicus]QEI21495.1 membrane protein insertion efficiency factor YidD [Cellvibrio japonicus]
MVWAGVKLLHGYRYLLSPWIGNQCRFYPSCSHYAEEALKTHGFLAGIYLTARRLIKCHPWHPGGIDPVPEHEATCCSHTHPTHGKH